MKRKMKRVLSLVFAVALLFTVKFGESQEIKFKALYLYNFTKQIGWPPTAKTGDFVIAVVGSNPIYKKLSEIATGKMAGSQQIVVKKYNSIEEVSHCHMVFVASGLSNSENMDMLTQKFANKSTLIVTEKEDFIDKGSVINFVIRDEQMRFELSKSNALKNGLQISANLVKLAIQA
jgi:hypothetical protein